MDAGENSPPDSPWENEDLVETLDYLVAETAIHLDPILEVIELGEDSADGESDLSSKIDDWHCQVMRSWKHLLPFNCYLSYHEFQSTWKQGRACGFIAS